MQKNPSKVAFIIIGVCQDKWATLYSSPFMLVTPDIGRGSLIVTILIIIYVVNSSSSISHALAAKSVNPTNRETDITYR